MRVAIDARMVGPHMHGIGRYTWNLVQGLAPMAPDVEFHLLAAS